jgi:MmeI, N-terminal domain
VPLSWNEIRHLAIAFSKEWQGVKSEQAEKQTFWNEFFNVFGVRRRVVATFEEPVKRISGKYGFIDLFWPSVVLVEHKSLGEDLGKAQSQAFRYIQDLARDKPSRFAVAVHNSLLLPAWVQDGERSKPWERILDRAVRAAASVGLAMCCLWDAQ